MSFLLEIPLNICQMELRDFFSNKSNQFCDNIFKGPISWVGGTISPFYMQSKKEELSNIDSAFDNNKIDYSPNAEFALVYCNWQTNSIILARDYTGTRSLFYTIESEKLIVGSNVYDVITRRKERIFSAKGCLELLLHEYIADPNTLFKDVYSVQHGYRILLDTSGKIIKEISPQPLSKIKEQDGEDIYSNLKTSIIKAHHKRVTKENGLYLSGGIDSCVSAITLKKELGISNLKAFTFSTIDAEDDEVEYAKYAANQLEVDFEHILVDPKQEIDLEEIIEGISFLYPGTIMLNSIAQRISEKGLNEINIFAGQDTRLHTPHLNIIDRLLLDSLLNNPKIRSLIGNFGKILKNILPVNGLLTKAANRISYADDIAAYVQQFFYHLHPNKIIGNSQFANLYQTTFIKHLQKQLSGKLNIRQIYNTIVEEAWNRQYTDDIAYMLGSTEKFGNSCSLPYYDKELAFFSASLPMKKALKRTKGKAGHHDRSKKVDKFILRKAFEGELSPKLIYRDKAVCVTNHSYLNGCMKKYVSEYFNKPKLKGSSLDEKLGLSTLYAKAIEKNGCWKMSDYEQVVEIQNLIYLECIATKYKVSA